MAKLSIPIPKAGVELDFDTDEIPDAVYQEALFLGLKALANRGQEKFTKTLYPDAANLKEVSKAHAVEIHAQLMAGEFRSSRRASKSELSTEVKTEAMRLGRAYVKDGIKRQGGKIGHYEAKEITAAAKAMLDDPESGPILIEEAKANLERQKAVKVPLKVSSIPVSDKKVAAAEAKKTADKAKRDAAKAAKEATGGAKPKPAVKAKPPTVPPGAMPKPRSAPGAHTQH